MPNLHIIKPGLCRIVCMVFRLLFTVISMSLAKSGISSGWSTSPGELTPGKTLWWGPLLNGRGPNKRPALRKCSVSIIWHWCWVLVELPCFSILWPQREKGWHISVLICMWRVPKLVTPPPLIVWTHTHTHVYSPTSPLRLGICIVETAAKGTACLREREGAGERGSTREREGNQFLEKYCLSIPCQDLVCVVAFFWASVALALWLQPPTPLSTVNSTMGGLGRKLTKTSAKQNEVLKCVRLCLCLCGTVLWECWNIFSFQPYAYLWVIVRHP